MTRLPIDPSDFCPLCNTLRCDGRCEAPEPSLDDIRCRNCGTYFEGDDVGHYGKLADGSFGYDCPTTRRAAA